MTARVPDRERRLLPRWRTSAAAVAAGELKTASPNNALSVITVDASDFEELRDRFEREPTDEAAAELVAAGIVLGRGSEVREAASRLARGQSDVVPLMRELSVRLLEGKLDLTAAVSNEQFTSDMAVRYAAVVAGKLRVRRSPKNALAWMDLAHAHSVLGQIKKAEREVRVALNLAPENRFVLRTAARFFVHAGMTDHGLYVLRRSEQVRIDSWVMAAELALSNLAGEIPRSYRRARALSDADSLPPWHTAELDGALGTLALKEGIGKSRRFFRKSLRNPTENALAQAQWASTTHHVIDVPVALLGPDHAYEALALRFRAERRWEEALDACRWWSGMDPTSSRPLLVGSFISEAALESGSVALEFTTRRLLMAPGDFMALNNHIVALAYAGRVPEGQRLLDRLIGAKLDAEGQLFARATAGLIAFRGGDPERGTQLYMDAFDRARALKNRELQALVAWHLLREISHAESRGVKEVAERLWRSMSDLNASIPEFLAMRDRIVTSTESDKRPRTAESKSLSGVASLLQSERLIKIMDPNENERG